MSTIAVESTVPAPRFAVGLTGGIGCGKTTIADMFAARGAAIVDTDLIAHQLTAPGGAAMAEIQAAFGDDVVLPSGAMDRATMRAKVFGDPSARQRLEAILHPLIRSETEYAAAHAKGTYLIYVIPLLVESGAWQERLSRILVIDCPEQLQVQRVMRRNGLAEQQVRAIMAAQASRETRLAAADDVIVNDGNTDALQPQIDRLHALYCSLAASSGMRC